MQIHQLNQNSDSKAWDDYVDNHQEGSFFHLSGWMRVIAKTYQHKSHYIYATNKDNQIIGVLPLVEQKSFLFGHTLVSTPFCVYGGAIADSPEVQTKLEDEAIEIAKKLNVDHLELRYKSEQNNPKFLTKDTHCYFTYDLEDSDDKILAGVKKKQRAVIRQSLKESLETDFNASTKMVHDVYAESVRNLGTPVFPAKYFENLKQEFGERCELMTVAKEGKIASAVMSFYYKQQVLPYYGGGLFEARALKSNDLMYYALMCHAQQNKNCTNFDFGRSKNDSGSFKYKKHWGMEAIPLHYQYYLVKSSELPNLSPNNPKYQMFIKMWQKLPVKVSQFLGPFLSKYLG